MAVCKCMKTAGHREHREHREMIVSSVPSVRTVANNLHTFQNQNSLHRSLRLEELRRELVQVVSPVDPRMAAFSFSGYRRESVLLEQVHGAAAAVKQEVIFADADPEKLQPFFQIGVIELGLMLFEPGFAGGRDLRRGVRGWRGAGARRMTREN